MDLSEKRLIDSLCFEMYRNLLHQLVYSIFDFTRFPTWKLYTNAN